MNLVEIEQRNNLCSKNISYFLLYHYILALKYIFQLMNDCLSKAKPLSKVCYSRNNQIIEITPENEWNKLLHAINIRQDCCTAKGI